MVLVRMDKWGRILIPKSVRDEIKAEHFELSVEKDKLILRTISRTA